MYLPMIVRPIVAKNAAIPTSQFASMPETMISNQLPAPPSSL